MARPTPRSPERGPRLWRTLRRFWSTALASELEYQANALVELLAVIGNLAGSLFVLSLFFRQGEGLGGWSWPAAQVVLGAYTVLDGLTSTLLRPNLSRIVTHVKEGTLDFVLLKPIDSQFWLSTRTLSPWGLPEMGLGLALCLGAAWQSGAQPGPLQLAGGGLAGGMLHRREQQPTGWQQGGAAQQGQVDRFTAAGAEDQLARIAAEPLGQPLAAALQQFRCRQTPAVQAGGIGPGGGRRLLHRRQHLRGRR